MAVIESQIISQHNQVPIGINYCNNGLSMSHHHHHHNQQQQPINCHEDIHPILAANIKKQNYSHCVGCGGQIHDQYILQVAPDLEWHAACLKCQECRQFLDESCTCFVRDGKTYCKRDYVRLFGTKCDKCGNSFCKNDFVMRAKSKIYHIECFRCTACSRHLNPGDEFALRDGNSLFCKMDNDALDKLANSGMDSSGNEFPDGNCKLTGSNNNLSEFGSMSDSESESGSHKNMRVRGKPLGSSDGKTRVRTVLNEKQLHTLTTWFQMNPKPDALMKEQLVEMTGLSPRVIRVWFQNKRCKQNKKANQLKIQMEQEKEMKQIGYGRMHGIPLIATSPIRNEELPLNVQSFEVSSFQPQWKMISDLAIHADTKSSEMMNSPTCIDIVNQISCHFRDVSV